jgi:8-amino-7-oxononanoate synthase
LIVSDTVFSMDGDLAPLADLGDLARRHDCLLLLDEAHATGVLGPHGRGATELLPGGVALDADRLIKVGTLSKALGAQGGFVCGPRRLIRWLINFARPYVFSTALAPPTAAAARRAVAIVREEPERRQQLQGLAQLLRDRLRELGYPESGSRCQIVPLVVGNARAAVRLSRRLEERGLLVPAIRPPSVPEGTARLRISLTAGHTEDDVLRLVSVLRELRPSAPVRLGKVGP